MFRVEQSGIFSGIFCKNKGRDRRFGANKCKNNMTRKKRVLSEKQPNVEEHKQKQKQGLSSSEQDVTEGKQQTKIASNKQTSKRQTKTIKPNSQSAHIPLQLNFNSIWIIKRSKPHHCRLNASTIITG